MSDQLTVLFDHLRGQQPPAPFAPPFAVRRRGQQRKHRHALAAGTAAFTAAGLAVGVPWIADLDQGGGPPVGGSPTTTAAGPSPSPTAPASLPSVGPGVPEALMLAPSEIGAGVRAEEVDDQGPDGPSWMWAEAMAECPGFRAADYPVQRERTAARILSYVEGGGAVAFELVERFPGDRSTAAFEEAPTLVSRCRSFPAGERAVVVTVVARDVAGDDSVLVRLDNDWPTGGPPDLIQYYVTVRVGEFLATVRLDGGSESQARALGRAAAARLG